MTAALIRFGCVKNWRKTFYRSVCWPVSQGHNDRNRQRPQYGCCCKESTISVRSPCGAHHIAGNQQLYVTEVGWSKIVGHFKHANTAWTRRRVSSLGCTNMLEFHSTEQRSTENKTLAHQKHSLVMLNTAEYDKLAKLESLLEPCR